MRGRREPAARAERACRSLIRMASFLIPHDRRAAWREEWEAEVWHHLRGRRNTPGPASGVAMVVRCLGAFPHAMWLRTERWSVHALITSLRLATRTLGRDPAFSLPAIIVFALAVAASATVFSSYEAVVLRGLTFEEPDRLVSVWDEHIERGWYQEYVAPANLLDWREQVSAFEDVAAYGDFTWEQILLEGGEAEVVDAGPVSGNIFALLGAEPMLGRTFRMEETWSDSDPVTVLGYDFWLRRFGGDPNVIGRRLELSGVSYEVVGVMPADFRYLAPDKELWVPFRWGPEARSATFFRRAHLVRAVARLSPEATQEEAADQLRIVATRLAEAYPATNEGLSAGLTPLDEYLVGDRESTLRALVGAAMILLLAACVNVGYLILVRWRRRHRDVAIRRALGAGAGALARDAALESLLISMAGAGLGVFGSLFGMRLMGVLAPPELLATTELRVNGPILLFASVVMAVAALLFALLPLRATTGIRPAGLAEHGTRAAVSARRGRGIRAFVVLQVALSAVLIFSAVLLARSFVALRSVEPGFTASGVLTFAVPFPDQSDQAAPERVASARRISGDLEQLRGVVSVGAVRRLPVTGNGWTSFFSIQGAAPDAGSFEIVHREADSGYFEAMQVPLVGGRLFEDGEGDAIVVNETFVRRAFGPDDPLGQRIAFTERPSESTRFWRIVGVVGDERQNGLRAEARPEVFTHYTFDVPATFRFVVRTSVDPTTLVSRARQALRDVDPGLPMDEVATLEDVVASSLAEDRFIALLATAFAVLAGLLAVVGVYGITAQAAEAWRREFAVRLAVGARPLSLFVSVLTRGATVVTGGLALGVLGSLWSVRFVEAFLFETSSTDPVTLVISATLVTASGLAAALPSALRAMRTDPARSLAT
jgi:putative ABC transport system permease protein